MRAIASASASRAARASGDALDSLVLVDLDLRYIGHALQHREREAFAGEEERPEADADRRLDRLQPDAVGEAVRIRDAVREEGEGDRCLQETDVPRPEGE